MEKDREVQNILESLVEKIEGRVLVNIMLYISQYQSQCGQPIVNNKFTHANT